MMACQQPPEMSHFGVVSSPILPPYGLVIWRLIGFVYLMALLIRVIDHNSWLVAVSMSVIHLCMLQLTTLSD